MKAIQRGKKKKTAGRWEGEKKGQKKIAKENRAIQKQMVNKSGDR